jgi:hypothetical protein
MIVALGDQSFRIEGNTQSLFDFGLGVTIPLVALVAWKSL